MSTDVMTPARTAEAERRRAASSAGRTRTAEAPQSRRPQRPARRPRPDRPGGPVLPASPVRPASPIRPAGPGRTGRTIRTVGPPRHSFEGTTPRTSTQPAAGAAAAATAARARPVGRTSFVVLVLGLLAGSLVCLLVVNTTLAANSIQINHLEHSNASTTQRIQQLQQEVAAAQTAKVIANEARRLGMRPQQVPAFVDLRHHSLRVGREPKH
ncbi:MAG: hypothetical protein LBV34_04875 [Nocardiopsaceae bacterium]|nr:hypothetical protein [Nocardiopsaceae bacterium]